MKHVHDSIQAYIGGELNGDALAAVEEHLAGCADCRAELDRTRRVWDDLETIAVPRAETRSVWPAVRARTLGRDTSRRDWFFGAGRLVRAGLATAAVAAGLVVGILLPAVADRSVVADLRVDDASWLVDSSWLSGSSWLTSDRSAGLDDILLGTDLTDEGNGS